MQALGAPVKAGSRRDAGSQRCRAFGLPLDLRFTSPLLPSVSAANFREPTAVRIADREELVALCGPEMTRVSVLGDPASEFLAVDYAPGRGFLVSATGFGEHFVALDGLAVSCAPPDPHDWYWQRILIAQVLPLASVLRGLELLHASAVAYEDSTVALVGPPTAGKTSVAMNLVLRGGRLVTDDVLAIELGEGGEVRAHPGSGLVSMRTAEHEKFSRLTVSIGRELGRDTKGYWLIPTTSRPRPLRALYLLERASHASSPRFERLLPLDPRLLLRNSFCSSAMLRHRITNQLAVFAGLERATPVFRAVAPSTLDAENFAIELEAHARTALSEALAPSSW